MAAIDPAEHLGLVRHVVRRFAALGLDAEELFQVGCVGLVKAAERFDPGFGTAFSTYAVPLILGEIQRFLRDQGPLAMDRGAKHLAHAARRRAEELRQSLGREPTVGELAGALGTDPAELAAALEGVRPPAPLEEASGAEAPAFWDRLELRRLLDQLPPRERQILARRYFLEQTQSQIGRALGLSQAQVSRLEKRAIERLRRAVGSG